MTRLDVNIGSEVAARLEGEGLVKLHRRPADETCDDPPDVARSMQLVKRDLRIVFWDLALGGRPWPLYLHGLEGRGKTRAVLAFCDLVATARYWTVDRAMESVAAGKAPWFRSGVELAVLDELGLPRVGGGKDFDYQVVKRFLDWREGRPAIFISNQLPDQIGGMYCPRVASRLSSGSQFQLVDRDRRLREVTF